MDVVDLERREISGKELGGPPVTPRVGRIDHRPLSGEQVRQFVAVGPVRMCDLLRRRHNNLRQQGAALIAQSPDRHPLGGAGRRRALAGRLEACGFVVGGDVAGKFDEGPGAALQCLLSSARRCGAPAGQHIAPGQQCGEAHDDRHDDDRHEKSDEVAVDDEAGEIAFGHDDQHHPVTVAEHSHRFGRDDDALIPKVQGLATIALDAQPVVGLRQRGVADLVEQRRFGALALGYRPIVAGEGDDSAGPVDDVGLATRSDHQPLQEGAQRASSMSTAMTVSQPSGGMARDRRR